MKVLLVDDSSVVHMIVKSIFTTTNYKLTWAGNGQIALDMLGKGETFDVILLDWNMPVMDGPTFLIEFFKVYSKTPIIMLTTENSPVYIERAISLGVSEYIMKPFTDDILLSKMEMTIDSFGKAS